MRRKDAIKKIMLKAGRYYDSAQFLYHKLFKNELNEMGFRVVLLERDHVSVWHIRVRGTASAQNYLLVSRPLARRPKNQDLMAHQLKAEMRRIAAQLGPPIKSTEINVIRRGAYFTIAFIWEAGTPGLMLRKEPKPDAFQFLIRPWLRTHRN